MKQIVVEIRNAIIELGGVATLNQIYSKCSKYSDSYIRQQIQSHSSDTKTTPKFEDIFFTVNGLGKGVWGVRNYIVYNAVKEDEQQYDLKPERRLTTFNRILRDTALAIEIKKLVDFECQLCSLRIELPNKTFYIEAHHIKPLGKPYNGPDIQSNIIIVCPNCHIKCDYKVIDLSLDKIRNNKQGIDNEFIAFHNNEYEVRIE